MFKYYDLDTDFGMESPISLNEIDDSAQFYTFSAGEKKGKSNKIHNNHTPVLNIDLKALIHKEDIKVFAVNYKSIKRNPNCACSKYANNGVTHSVVKQAKVVRSSNRKPLRDRNSICSGNLRRDTCQSYKPISPFQRNLSLNLYKSD